MTDDGPKTRDYGEAELTLCVATASADIDRFLDGWYERSGGDESACRALERLVRLLVSEVGLVNLAASPPGRTLRGSVEIDSFSLSVRVKICARGVTEWLPATDAEPG